MNPALHTLPLDWSGKSPDNRTRGELCNLADQNDLPFRVATLRHGYFFTESLIIEDDTGYRLKENRDYQCVGFSGEATGQVGTPVCAVIVVINPKVGLQIRVDAQMVGGPYCSVAPAILGAAKGLQSTTRKIHWNNITGKPDKYRPNGHLHALWDLFGFTPQVVQLKRMTKAYESIVQRDLDGMKQTFDTQMAAMEATLATVSDQLKEHIADKTSNPHRDTKAKLVPPLTNTPNQPRATDNDARQPNSNVMDRYATPRSMHISIKTNVGDKVDGHAKQKGNVHRLTPAQLSVYSIGDWNTKALSYATRGSTLEKGSGVWGNTTATHYTNQRSNNYTTNINVSAGRLSPARFSTAAGWPGRDFFLSPNGNWYDIGTKWRTFDRVTARVVPIIGPVFESNSGASAFNLVVAHCNTHLANLASFPVGSIAIARVGIYRFIATGNGGDIKTTTDNIAIVVRAPGGWTASQGPNA